MFDFHLHLARLPNPESVGKALSKGGIGFNNIACEPWEWEKSLELMKSKNFADVPHENFAFGIHPMIAGRTTESDLERLEQILRSGHFAVGECGLDKRFEGYENAGKQEQIFKWQIKMAQELNRPLHIHCVGDYFRAQALILGESKNSIPVIFHRFGGDSNFVKAALKNFGDKVIFSLHADSFRKKSTAASIGTIPLKQIRFETDADESFKIREISSLYEADKSNSFPTPEQTANAIAHQLKMLQEKLSE